MKKAKIKGVSVNVFTVDELTEKLGFNQEDAEVVIKYQKTFPELLQDECDENNFSIDVETLWEQLDKPQGRFNMFLDRKIKGNLQENEDWTFAQACVKGGRPKQVVKLKLESAKHLVMTIGMDKNSSEEVREKGNLVRKYFVLMEKAFRDYEKWTMIREPQKESEKALKVELDKAYIKRKTNEGIEVTKTPAHVYSNESNMINRALIGMTSKQLKELLEYKDKSTRDHFNSKINKTIDNIQIMDMALVIAGMDYNTRKEIVENHCKSNYIDIKEHFEEIKGGC